MNILDQRDEPPAVSTSSARLHRAIWLAVAIGAAVAACFLFGCAPMSGPGTSQGKPLPRPEEPVATITRAAGQTTAEVATVTTSAGAIKAEVAAMVPSVREAATVAPAPAARIAQGHEVIYAEAQKAETAASQAGAHVATISDSAAQAQAQIAELRRAYDGLAKSLEAKAAELERARADADAGVLKLARAGIWAGGLIMAAGVALLFLLRGNLLPGIGVIGAGATLLALASLLQRFAAWLPYVGLALLLAVVAGVVLALRSKAKREALLSAALSGAVGFGEQLKSAAPEAIKGAKDWAKDNLPKPVRDEIWEHLPVKKEG